LVTYCFQQPPKGPIPIPDRAPACDCRLLSAPYLLVQRNPTSEAKMPSCHPLSFLPFPVPFLVFGQHGPKGLVVSK
jgi:hypothetical protein